MLDLIVNWFAARKARKQLCKHLNVMQRIPDRALAYLANDAIFWHADARAEQLYAAWVGEKLTRN